LYYYHEALDLLRLYPMMAVATIPNLKFKPSILNLSFYHKPESVYTNHLFIF